MQSHNKDHHMLDQQFLEQHLYIWYNDVAL